MERAGRGENDRTASARADQLDRGFDRLSAGRREEAAREITGSQTGERISQFLGIWSAVRLHHRRFEGIEGGADGVHDAWRIVTECDSAILRVTIEEAAVVAIEKPDSFAAHPGAIHPAERQQPAECRVK